MDELEIIRKRLYMRSMRRGTKEMDLILKNFAQLKLHSMSEPELENFENLLSENDQDLYQWSTGIVSPKQEFAELIRDIKIFISNSNGLTS
jgi:antitoxin CptB